jgi:hypothetical protein
VRLIQAVSRFDETPPELLIELTDDGYRSLGEPGEAAKQQSAREVLDILPTTKAKAFDIKTLVKKTTKTRAELQRLLDALLKKGLVEKIGKGSKGDPFRFFSG